MKYNVQNGTLRLFYFTTFISDYTDLASMVGLLLNDAVEKMSNEAVMEAVIEQTTHHHDACLEGLE